MVTKWNMKKKRKEKETKKKKISKYKHLPKLVNLGSVNEELALLRKKTFLYRRYFADLIFSLWRILERRAPEVFGEKGVPEVGRDAAVRYKKDGYFKVFLNFKVLRRNEAPTL